MAERKFSVRHVPGAAPIAIVTFIALYAPIVILIANAFNAGPVIGRWEGFSLRWFASAMQNEPFATRPSTR